MRSRVLVPVVLLVCACSTGNDRPAAASGRDSAAVVTELSPAAESAAKRRQDSPTVASSSKAVPAPAANVSATKPSAPPVAEAPPQEPSDFRCGIRNSPVLSSLGIGNLQIGRTVDIVKRTCRVTRDGDEMLEGTRERVLTVLLDQDPVRVTVTNGLIWRISVRSPRIETRDGLHVGTSLARLVARGDVRLFEGEDGLYVTLASHCGLSFRFSIPSRETPGKAWTVAHVLQRHGSAVADRILVTRCIE